MTEHRSGARCGTGDSGVVLILMAVFMIGILTMVAIVLDLGQLRADRREDQKSADFAALAAGYYMSGKASGSGAAISNPRAACNAALESAKANVTGFPPGATMDCASFPANAKVCEDWQPNPLLPPSLMPMTTETTNASASPFVLTIKYPVPDAEIMDTTRFAASGAGAADGTDQCARLLVKLQSTRDTTFARIIGVPSQTINAISVVKSELNSVTKSVAALLLLERSDCTALSAGGQGTVIVESASSLSGVLNPGRIHADSEGKGTCTTRQNEDGYVIYAAGTGNARIDAKPVLDGFGNTLKPGIIGIYGLTPGINGRGGAEYTSASATNGLSVAPVAGGIASRRFVDDRYNPTTRQAISQLQTRAWNSVVAPPSGIAGTNYTLVSGALCNEPGPISGLPLLAATKVVYVDCPEFTAGASSTFVDATDVYFTGKVTVATNKTLSLPLAERIYIRGCRVTGSPPSGSTNCGNNETSNANAYALNVNGTFLVNSPTFSPCMLFAPSSSPLSHRVTEIATLGGPVISGGGANIAMCQTSLYIGRTGSTYARLERASGLPNCDTDLPCPADSFSPWIDEGYINISGGNGVLHWSAPNRLSTAPATGNPFEDLALWAEGARPSFLKGTGASRTAGVYFLPNSRVTFQGQGAQAVPQNAQFFARSITISGLGTLRMSPNPDDAIPTPTPGGYSLIR